MLNTEGVLWRRKINVFRGDKVPIGKIKAKMVATALAFKTE
jgi:hypothetical protein